VNNLSSREVLEPAANCFTLESQLLNQSRQISSCIRPGVFSRQIARSVAFSGKPQIKRKQPAPGEVGDPSRQRLLIFPDLGRMPLHRPGLAQHPACPAFTHAQFFLDVIHRFTPTRRAQKFGRAASRRIDLSSSASASRRFNRAFSCSSSLNRRAWSTFNPPYSFRQRK
jgi:hypothetical protein